MDIIFETQKGRQFTIEIGYFDSVLEIKEKVHKYHGIPVDKQTLVFNNQILPDEGDVASCVLLHNSRVQLFFLSEPEKPSQVKIEEINEPINRSLIQPALQGHRPYELVDNVDIGVNNNNNNNNNVRRPSPTPSRSGSAGPMMGGGSSRKLRLKVLTSCGKIPIEVNPTDNVGELRKELERMQQSLNFQLSPEGYFFICNQNVMEENRSFRWNHVVQGDTIEIFNGSVTGGP
ncbi:ubiquitin domain-containing protein 7SL RNA1-like [Tripterygium wilfordii]|uniref:ubiquitin domain-containing protein 7SL RNA1-like n=1 Tax=Tripterygium wilfordii TaxID=458696 RepID=UPI0018F84789|nr:ubiquitin domain-containing protein 7SL RNA1-like [Tripterygium wilfordii]